MELKSIFIDQGGEIFSLLWKVFFT